ncbi:MAG: DUF3604 domain-containing protein [bacterium]
MIPPRIRLAVGLVLFSAALSACGGGGDSGSPGAAKDDVPPAELGTYLHVVAPSVVRRGDPVDLRLRVVTQAGLPDYDFEGAFRISTSSDDVEFPKPMSVEPQKEGSYVMRGIKFLTPGVQFVRGSVPEDTVQALANPINVADDPEWRVYWGDLNGHSDLSSGSRPPGVHFWYAKAVALLDFAALTDHDAWAPENRTLDEATFLDIAEVAEDQHEPGVFVPFVGLEWTSREYGSRLVYWPDQPTSLPSVASGVDTPEKLRAALPEGAVIAVAHPSGSEVAASMDPASIGRGQEDLIEIYSARGIFETAASHRPSSRETPGTSVRDLLLLGFDGGFIATGDGELSAPANPRPFAYADHPYPGGLTAVLAKELTRPAILDALRAGRCYATTGERYLLEFTVDGAVMGSTLRVKKGHEAEVYGSLGSTTNWVRVEIVEPKGTLAVLTPDPGQADVVEITAKTPPVAEPTWVYLRGIDERGGMAWSSPIRLVPE